MLNIFFLLGLSVVTVVAFLLMGIVGMRKHKKRVLSYQEALSSELDKTVFDILLQRYVGYMRNYYFFQGLG